MFFGALWSPGASAASARVIDLNNEGVKALNRKDFATAVEKFEEAIRLDPEYKLARQNLSVAYGNLALAVPKRDCIRYLHGAVYADPTSATAASNLQTQIKALGKDPASFADRVELGDAAVKQGDHAGGIVEYEAALKIRDDAAVRAKLAIVPKPLSGSPSPESSLPPEVKELRQAGLKALEQDDLAGAADKFEELLKKHPDQLQARVDLAGTYAKLSAKVPKTDSLRYLHQAVYLYPLGSNTRDLEARIRESGKDPKSFEDRLKLAEQALATGDDAGAIVEYKAALDIRQDTALKAKLGSVSKPFAGLRPGADVNWDGFQPENLSSEPASSLSGSSRPGSRPPVSSSSAASDGSSSPPSGSTASGSSGSATAQPSKTTSPDPTQPDNVDFYPLMEEVQARIIKSWNPPRPLKDKETICISFKVARDGTVSAVELGKDRTDSQLDNLALETVRKLGKVAPPPAKAAHPVGVVFNFKRRFTGSCDQVTLASVDFGSYMADLQRRIKRSWFPPKGHESRRVVVLFKIDRSGRMSELKLDKTSGVSIADKAALEAVKNASPFRPLPSGSPVEVDIQFSFDYNVYDKSRGGYVPPEGGASKALGFDYDGFMETIQRKLKEVWHPPAAIGDRIVVVTFEVTKDGSVGSCEVESSCGAREIDDAALAAVGRLHRVDPPPTNAPDPVEVRCVLARDFWGVSENVCIDNIDYAEYLAGMAKGVSFSWKSPAESVARPASVAAEVDRTGKVSNVKLLKSSGTGSFDSAAVSHLKNCTQVKPPPSGAPNLLDVVFKLGSGNRVDAVLKVDEE